jgi:hypothetical protein
VEITPAISAVKGWIEADFVDRSLTKALNSWKIFTSEYKNQR